MVLLDYTGTSITFAKTRFGYIEFLFHTLYCNWGRKYRSLYWGLRYIEFCYIQVPLPHPSPQVLTFVPIRSFPSLWLSLIPHPLSSGDTTKWFSINSVYDNSIPSVCLIINWTELENFFLERNRGLLIV